MENQSSADTTAKQGLTRGCHTEERVCPESNQALNRGPSGLTHPCGTYLMMTYRKLGEYVTAEPFRPFRIRMASGHAFEIRHPEMILVGRTSARIHAITTEDQNEKWHDASMLIMETVEPLDAPQPQTNG